MILQLLTRSNRSNESFPLQIHTTIQDIHKDDYSGWNFKMSMYHRLSHCSYFGCVPTPNFEGLGALGRRTFLEFPWELSNGLTLHPRRMEAFGNMETSNPPGKILVLLLSIII
jgi:hypothetical protein